MIATPPNRLAKMLPPPSPTGNDGAVTNDDAGPAKGPPPSILPVSYPRPDVGTPLTATELQTATDELIALLKDTRYFDFVDERIHGWPKGDPNNGYWWGTTSTGITATKSGGTVTYKHSNDGTDNAGIVTSPYLEGACYAHLLWGQAKTADLVRRIARGMSGWVIAMERTAGDTTPTLLARSLYPPPVMSNEGGRSLFIDTSLSRPGIDANPSSYIHHPNNPTLGDIYVKNKRSKDNIGHMLRAITLAETCAPRFDADAQADMTQLETLYEAWQPRSTGAALPSRRATQMGTSSCRRRSSPITRRRRTSECIRDARRASRAHEQPGRHRLSERHEHARGHRVAVPEERRAANHADASRGRHRPRPQAARDYDRARNPPGARRSSVEGLRHRERHEPAE